MKKTASRCLAATLAFLLGIDSAAACRWMRSGGCAPSSGFAAPAYAAPAYPAAACCPPVATSCCPPLEPGFGCEVVVSSGCGCESTVVSGSTVVQESSAPTHYDTYDANPTPTPADPPEPTQVFEPAPTPAPFGDGFRSDTAVTENAAPSEAWDAGLDQQADDGFAEQGATFNPEPVEELPPAEPTLATQPEVQPLEAPADDDLFGDDAGFDDAGFGDEPVQEPMPEDTLFDAPAEEAQPEAPADDLFGDEPMEEESGDLFGDDAGFGEDAPAEEPMPADDLFGDDAGFGEEAPADEAPAADDLFGDGGFAEEAPIEEAPAEGDLFGGDADFAEEAPAEAAPAEDDLFGDGGFGDEAPAEEMPAEDNLFGDDAGYDDGGFGEEAPAEEAPAEAPADESGDDLFDFGGGDDLFGEEPADAGDAPAEEEAGADLFDFGAVLNEPGGTQSAQDRTWVDNTGRFSTVGSLLAIDGNAVRLSKPTGAVATVPLGRLSQADLEFVSRQAMAMSEAREWAIAHGVRPDADAPKQAKSNDSVVPLRTAQL